MSDETNRVTAMCDAATAIMDVAEAMREVTAEMEHWVWTHVVAPDVLPRQLPPEMAALLVRLHERIDALPPISEKLRHVASGPAHKYLSGQPLLRSEFYYLLADGSLKFECGGSSAYTEFMLFHYEDDERMGYISQRARNTVGFGIVAEDVRRTHLRPEHADFFRANMPALFERFLD